MKKVTKFTMKSSKGEVNVPQSNHQNSLESSTAVVRTHKPKQDFSGTENKNGISNSWVSLRLEPQVGNGCYNNVNGLEYNF